MEAVFYFVPERRATEAPLAHFFQHTPVALAVDAEGIDHVFEDAHRKRVGLLEHHAHPLAKLDHIDRGAVDRIAAEEDIAGHMRVAQEIVEAIDGAEQRRLAATARADQRGDFILGNPHRDFMERLLRPVPEAEVVHFQHGLFFREAAVKPRWERSCPGRWPRAGLRQKWPDSAAAIDLRAACAPRRRRFGRRQRATQSHSIRASPRRWRAYRIVLVFSKVPCRFPIAPHTKSVHGLC